MRSIDTSEFSMEFSGRAVFGKQIIAVNRNEDDQILIYLSTGQTASKTMLLYFCVSIKWKKSQNAFLSFVNKIDLYRYIYRMYVKMKCETECKLIKNQCKMF